MVWRPGAHQYGTGNLIGGNFASQWQSVDYWWDSDPTISGLQGWWQTFDVLSGFSEGPLTWSLDSFLYLYPGPERCDVSRPPSAVCSDNYQRKAETTLTLYPSRAPQTVVINVKDKFYEMVWDQSAMDWIPAKNEYGNLIFIDPSRISIDGKSADCNGDIAIKCLTMSPKNVTPTVASAPNWYRFSLPIVLESRFVPLSAAKHPDCSAPPVSVLQGLYNNGAYQLASDSDNCVSEEYLFELLVAGLTELYEYYYEFDGVKSYVDFKISQSTEGGAPGLFPPGQWGQNYFRLEAFNVIPDETYLNTLLEDGDFADVKLVTSMPALNNQQRLGWSIPGSSVIVGGAGDQTLIHEWSHFQGNGHTPASASYHGRLMYPFLDGGGWRVVRAERANLQ